MPKFSEMAFIRLLFASAAVAAAPAAFAYPINSQFTINSTTSNLKLRAEAFGFNDDDTKSLNGSLNVTLDFGANGFGTPAKVTVNSGTITPSGNYTLTLGFPPILGVKAVASGLAAQVSTPTPPGTMTRTVNPGVVYSIDTSQFLVTMNQGSVVVTGSTNQTIDLAAEPVAGTSPPGTLGTLTLTTGATSGYFTRINAALSLPFDVTEIADLDGTEVEMRVTGTVNATSSFYLALADIPGDFQLDGDVDATDLALWKTGFGRETGATPNDGDANGDGRVDGTDFLVWQRNFGVQPPAVAASTVAAVPEPTSIGLCATMLGATAAARRRSNKVA
ncbi:dockerin type I domain-containing protein [Lacipirellula sp.]|uniref:dockerin type I domain-containing protein n=1 Tax=Lacipirellula sp. TaxID=2691419 RepID=UPI003D0A9B00